MQAAVSTLQHRETFSRQFKLSASVEVKHVWKCSENDLIMKQYFWINEETFSGFLKNIVSGYDIIKIIKT